MTAVIAMHPSRFGAIRSLVPFQDYRLGLREIHSLSSDASTHPWYKIRFHPIDQGNLMDADRLAQVARVYGRSAQFDGDVVDSAMQWLSEQDSDVNMMVAVSALSLEDESFVPRLLKIAEQHEVNPRRVCFELDQAVFHPNEEDVKESLEALRQSGFRTGLCRQGGLDMELCANGLVDYLTIGRRHVGAMLEDPKRRRVVTAMGEFARVMDLQLIADGVENYARLGALIESGVGHACGPLYGEERFVSLRA